MMKENNLQNIKLLILDVDGVLSDGKIIISNDGDECKNFDVKDGLGLILVQKIDIKVAVITGKLSRIVVNRLTALGLDYGDIFQGQKNKLNSYQTLKDRYDFRDNEIAYMGDDLPDIVLMNIVGLSAAPADCISIVKNFADYNCKHNGGNGAVREFCEYLMKQRGQYEAILQSFIEQGGLN